LLLISLVAALPYLLMTGIKIYTSLS